MFHITLQNSITIVAILLFIVAVVVHFYNNGDDK